MLEAAAVAGARELLDGALRVTLTDGRVVVGVFTCFDTQRNVLLADCQETQQGEGADMAGQTKRHLGLVIVPREHIVACHAVEVG